MRIRIKFSKVGSLRYIGHLDVMRFFQKAVRRAGFDVVYSEGFSPHMLMSFAQPLGVGMTSVAEYFDLDIHTSKSSREMMRLLNEQMPQEAEILSIVKIPEDKASKCMTLVAAADYSISLKDGDFSEYADAFGKFMSQDKIEVIKKTKRSETLTDIKPLVYSWNFANGSFNFKSAAGSVNNLKPSLLIKTFLESCGKNADDFSFDIQRRELYAEKDGEFIPLYMLGEEIV